MGGKWNILVVDDEPRQRKGLIDSLHYLMPDTQILGARNGDDAIEQLRNHKINILFSDIRMPKTDGLELASKALVINPEIYIILVSGYADFEYAQKAIELGAFGYILKPVSIDAVEEIVKKIMSKNKENIEKRKREKENTWNQAKDIYQDYLISKWVNEDLTSEEEVFFAEFLEVYREGQIFIMSIDNVGEISTKEEKREIIENILEHVRQELGPERIFLHSLSNIRNRYLGIVSVCEINLYQMLTRCKKEMNLQYGFSISCIIGKEHHDLNMLRKGYHRLCEMEKYFFYAPFDKVWKIEACVEQEKYTVNPEKETLSKIRKAVLEGQEDEIAIYFADIFSEMEREKPNPKYTAEILGIILLQLLSAVQEFLPAEDYEILKGRIIETGEQDCFPVFRSKVYQFLYELISSCWKGKRTISPVHQAILYIEKNYDQEMSLNTLARKFNYSPNYFSALFKNVTGENLVSYVNRVRLKKACELIKSTEWNNNAIADRVGIHDYKYFNRLFKKYYGCSVSEYRKNAERIKD